MRKQFSATEKATVALEAVSGKLKINEVASRHDVHPTQVKQWRDQLKNGAVDLFADKRRKDVRQADMQAQIDELHRVIGKRDAELEWLKKSRPVSIREARMLIDVNNPEMSMVRQAGLLGVNRSSLYYAPVINEERVELDKLHMDAIDAIYTRYPFYGTRRMKLELVDDYGIDIDRLRIAHLMERLGIQAIYPKPNLSKPASQHKKYPYLLKGMNPSGRDQLETVCVYDYTLFAHARNPLAT
jgi:putative transposase